MDASSQLTPATEVTPIPISPRVRTILVLAAVAGLILLFSWSASLLSLLLGGATLAMVLSVPVRLLSRILPRRVAIAIVFVSLPLLAVLALVTGLPALIRELGDLIVALPRFAAEAEGGLLRILEPLVTRGLLPAEPSSMIPDIRQGLLTRVQILIQWLLGGVFGVLSGAAGTFLNLFGVLFIAVYLLADIRRFKAVFIRAAPPRYRRDAQQLWDDLGRSLSRYLGGLLVLLALQGMMAYVLNLILGVPYAFLLGMLTAITGVLPYVGAWIGAIPGVVLALFVSPWTGVLSALGYLAIQQIESNVLTPRIQGSGLKVHPLLVFLAVVIGGELGGLLGAALAVPTLAVLRVLFDFFAARLHVRQPAEVGAVSIESSYSTAHSRPRTLGHGREG